MVSGRTKRPHKLRYLGYVQQTYSHHGTAPRFTPPPAASYRDQLFERWTELARRGEFAAAWRVSDRALELHRHSPVQDLPPHFRTVWDGTSVIGRRVFVRCYHGLGDTIQFVRLLPALSAVASEVVLCAQSSLRELLSRSFGLCPAKGDPASSTNDVVIEVMELGHILRIDLQSIGMEAPYLSAEAIPVESTGGLRVGLVWQAGDWDDRRSIEITDLAPLLSIPGVKFYSLQLNAYEAGWREEFGTALDAGTVTRMAGLMRSLDLIITVDTMAAHLAGALARPVWTLLQADADWRWMEDRSDSPWYPSMRLFRQRQAGVWGPVVYDVAQELSALTVNR